MSAAQRLRLRVCVWEDDWLYDSYRILRITFELVQQWVGLVMVGHGTWPPLSEA